MFVPKKYYAFLLATFLLFGTQFSSVHAQTAEEEMAAPSGEETSSGSTLEPEFLNPEDVRALPSKKYDANYFYGRIDELSETEAVIPETDVAYIPQLGPKQSRVTQKVKVHILSGPHQGETVDMVNTYENQPRDLRLSRGDKVVIQQNTVDGVVDETMIVDFSRTTQAWILIVLFVLAILIYGRRQGVSSILGFVATFGILFLVFIPGIIAGWNPVMLAVVSSIVITFFVHFFVGGFSAKSLSSTIGTAGGTILAGILGAIAAHYAHLSGLSSEDARNLFVAVPTYDFNGIFLASIIIGSLGAVMDVGISIGSAVKEVKDVSPNATFKQLYLAGTSVGKDILGTMSNTLILAYIGASLPLLLLLHSYNNLSMSLDYDFIVDEIVRSIVGSLGLLSAIPITAYFSALFEMRPKKASKK